MPKSFWVQNCSRAKKEPVQATGLSELIDNGCSALGINRSKFKKLVFEKDGAEIDSDDEECFPFICNSVLMILSKDEKWHERKKEDQGDATTSATSVCSDIRLENLVERMLKDGPNCILDFSFEELKVIEDCPLKSLAHLLKMPENDAVSIRHKCLERLDEMDDELERKEWSEIIRQSEKRRKVENPEMEKKGSETDQTKGTCGERPSKDKPLTTKAVCVSMQKRAERKENTVQMEESEVTGQEKSKKNGTAWGRQALSTPSPEKTNKIALFKNTVEISVTNFSETAGNGHRSRESYPLEMVDLMYIFMLTITVTEFFCNLHFKSLLQKSPEFSRKCEAAMKIWLFGQILKWSNSNINSLESLHTGIYNEYSERVLDTEVNNENRFELLDTPQLQPGFQEMVHLSDRRPF